MGDWPDEREATRAEAGLSSNFTSQPDTDARLTDTEFVDAILANLRDDVQIILGGAVVVRDGVIDPERTERTARYMLTVCCTLRDKVGSWKERNPA